MVRWVVWFFSLWICWWSHWVLRCSSSQGPQYQVQNLSLGLSWNNLLSGNFWRHLQGQLKKEWPDLVLGMLARRPIRVFSVPQLGPPSCFVSYPYGLRQKVPQVGQEDCRPSQTTHSKIRLIDLWTSAHPLIYLSRRRCLCLIRHFHKSQRAICSSLSPCIPSV